MKRLRPWLFNLAEGMSLLLCIATFILWIVSYSHSTTTQWQRDWKTAWFFTVHRGRVEVARQSIEAMIPLEPQLEFKITKADVSKLGVVHVSGSRTPGVAGPPTVPGAGYPPISVVMSGGADGTVLIDPHLVQRSYLGFGRGDSFCFNLWTVPCWFVAIVCGSSALVWLQRAHRVLRRRSTGHCIACGYDLRASPERCPECGTVTASAA